MVKYLGITINRSTDERISQNFLPKIVKSKSIFNCWLQRDLTIMGRVLLSKAEGLSRLVYPALSLYVDRKTCAAIDSLLFKFVWRNRTEYVKRKTLIRQYSEGGLNVLDFQTINSIFKINWLKHCLVHNNTPWFFIPNHLFAKCGGLKFLLSCNFISSKLPVKLANFHKQALDSWKIAFKHNFSPHTCVLWNNQHVVYKNKTLFFKELYDQGIVFIYELLNDTGDLATYEEFTQQRAIDIPRSLHSRILKSIPTKVLSLIKASFLYEPFSGRIPTLWLGGRAFEERSCNNAHIRSVFTSIHSQYPNSFHRWREMFPNISRNVWTEFNRFLIPGKVKEVHIKLLHRYYPCNEFINKFRPDVSPLCSFCKEDVESFSHLFYGCLHSTNFWTQMSLLIWESYKILVTITEDMVLFLSVESNNKEINDVIKLLCLLGKFHIHKAKFLQFIPNETLFKVELNIFYDSVCNVPKNKKALKTSSLLGKIVDCPAR